jgi:hypothetical protein
MPANATPFLLSTLLFATAASCGAGDIDPQGPQPIAVVALPSPASPQTSNNSTPGFGTRISDVQLCTFKLGVTPIAEVVALFGRPQKDDRVSGATEALDVLYYIYQEGRTIETVTLAFGDSGLTAALRTHQVDQAKSITAPRCFVGAQQID